MVGRLALPPHNLLPFKLDRPFSQMSHALQMIINMKRQGSDYNECADEISLKKDVDDVGD